MQDNWPSVLFAMAGGVVLSIGNLSTQYAWAFVGLSVTEVLTSSITVVIGLSLSLHRHTQAPIYVCMQFSLDMHIEEPWIKAWQDCEFFIIISALIVTGTTMNYFLDDKINKAEILFPGVGCFLIAVCLASAVHTSNAADNKAKLNSLSSDIAGTEYAPFLHSYKWNYADLE
jgi:hypothetical protein